MKKGTHNRWIAGGAEVLLAWAVLKKLFFSGLKKNF